MVKLIQSCPNPHLVHLRITLVDVEVSGGLVSGSGIWSAKTYCWGHIHNIQVCWLSEIGSSINVCLFLWISQREPCIPESPYLWRTLNVCGWGSIVQTKSIKLEQETGSLGFWWWCGWWHRCWSGADEEGDVAVDRVGSPRHITCYHLPPLHSKEQSVSECNVHFKDWVDVTSQHGRIKDRWLFMVWLDHSEKLVIFL